MKRVNVEKWFDYEDSQKIEEQVKFFIASEIEAGLNCYYDESNTEPMTKQEWKEYVWNTIELLKGKKMNGNEYTHLKFYGKDNVMRLIDIYLDNYADIQYYIKNKVKAERWR